MAGVSEAIESAMATATEQHSSLLSADGAAPPPAKKGRAARDSGRRSQFVGCSCTKATCDKAPFKKGPAASNASDPARRIKATKIRDKWLRACAMNDASPTARPEVCTCHDFDEDRAPGSAGVQVTTPSRRPATATSTTRANPYNGVVLPDNAEQIRLLVEHNERLQAELELMRTALKEAARRAAEAEVRPPAFRYVHVGQHPDMLKTFTRFRSVADMEFFLALLCNGDFSVLDRLSLLRKKRARGAARANRSLNGHDMFLAYFMHEAGKTFTEISQFFGITRQFLTEVVATCSHAIALRARAFGKYTTASEAALLTPAEWKAKYPDEPRIHLWDMTNVNLRGKPTDALLQKLTYSSYYGTNCFKGGVGMTAFGWIFTGPLFTGGIGDTDYMVRSGLMDEQRVLAEKDQGPPVCNMTDKGFRLAAAGAEAGGQSVITPTFRKAEFEGRLDSVEAACSTCVAHDRAQNERAVRRLCVSDHLRHGIEPASDLQRVNRIWSNIGFRTNFINGPFNMDYLDEWEVTVNEELLRAGLPLIPTPNGLTATPAAAARSATAAAAAAEHPPTPEATPLPTP